MAVTMTTIMFVTISSICASTSLQQFTDQPWRPPTQWEWTTRETYPDLATQPELCKSYEQQFICDPNGVMNKSTGKIMHEISQNIPTKLKIDPVLLEFISLNFPHGLNFIILHPLYSIVLLTCRRIFRGMIVVSEWKLYSVHA